MNSAFLPFKVTFCIAITVFISNALGLVGATTSGPSLSCWNNTRGTAFQIDTSRYCQIAMLSYIVTGGAGQAFLSATINGTSSWTVYSASTGSNISSAILRQGSSQTQAFTSNQVQRQGSEIDFTVNSTILFASAGNYPVMAMMIESFTNYSYIAVFTWQVDVQDPPPVVSDNSNNGYTNTPDSAYRNGNGNGNGNAATANKSAGIGPGGVAGIVIAAVAVSILIVGAAYTYYQKKHSMNVGDDGVAGTSMSGVHAIKEMDIHDEYMQMLDEQPPITSPALTSPQH